MADVTLSNVVGGLASHAPRSHVAVSSQIHYKFYAENVGSTFGYSKSTDGGATWGSPVQISAATTPVGFDIWYDRWTPGDTGTLIHCWYFDSTNDKIFWRTLDTNGDTLGTERTAFTGASAVSGRGSFCSGTKTRSGYLYCAFDIDAGAEHGIVRSTDGGTTWSSNLATTFVEATIDQCILFPATGTGDNNDCWAVYQDASADALTMKMWDSSAAAEVESSTMQTMVENTSDTTGLWGFSGSVRHSDGHLIVVSFSEYDTATADFQVWDVSGVTAGSSSGITAKTDITTNIDDIYFPAVFIDQLTNDIYVAYNGKRDGSETLGTATKPYYTKSTDGGSTWSAGDSAISESAAGAVVQLSTPLMGGRFLPGWRVGASWRFNKVNSVSFNSASSLSGALSFAGAGVKQTARGIAAALSFIGSFATVFSPGGTVTPKALTATLSFVGGQSKASGKALAGALSFVGAIMRNVAHGMTAALPFVGSATKRTAHPLTATLSFVGAIARRSFRSVAGTLSFSGAQTDRTNHAMTAALSFVGSAAKRTSRGITATLSFVGAIAKGSIFFRTLTATLSFSGTVSTFVAHFFTKALTATLSFTTATTRFIRTSPFASSLSFIGSATKRGTKSFTGTIAFIGAFAKTRLSFAYLDSTLSFVGTQSKAIARALESALSFIGSFVRGGAIFRWLNSGFRHGSRGVNQ